MNKKWWISIVIILFIILLGAYFLGFLNPLNRFFTNQIPNKACNLDSDCILFKSPSDNIYCISINDKSMIDINDSRIIYVNKNWNPFCPFPSKPFILKIEYKGGYKIPSGYIANGKCINNICEKIIQEYSTE